MDKEQFLALIQKYLAGGTTLDEEQLLLNFYGSFQHSDVWDEAAMGVKAEIEAKMLERIQVHVARTNTAGKTYRLWLRVAAAVAVLTVGVWMYNTTRHTSVHDDTESEAHANDVAPGKNGATITLANGKVITLSTAKTGVVVSSDLKYNDNTAVSDAQGSELSGSGTVANLTASTSRGQTYQFTLPDGTKVWLNADSKISFPSQFVGDERKILLEGEGYFEVAHNPEKPFRVESKHQKVVVLGTHFNISAYGDDEVVTTTLLEGSVRVEAFNSATGREDLMLKPNQQSILNSGGAQVLAVDPPKVVAWKNGDFIFVDESLENIMKQLSRWYDVDIQYDNEALKQIRLGGFISRNKNVSAVLKMFTQTNKLTFKINGKKITVLPSL